MNKIMNHGLVERELNFESGGPRCESCFCFLPGRVTLGKSLNYLSFIFLTCKVVFYKLSHNIVGSLSFNSVRESLL